MSNFGSNTDSWFIVKGIRVVGNMIYLLKNNFLWILKNATKLVRKYVLNLGIFKLVRHMGALSI